MKNTSVILRGGYTGSKEELFYYEPITHEWHFSIYRLNENNFHKYYEKLCAINPKFIQAYPSAILRFSNYMLERGLSFHIDAVMLGSENLFSWQEKIIKKAFKTNIHSWYGQAEKVCLATQTKKSKLFHCYPQYGLTELINSNEDSVKIEGESGQIVGTSFINFAMPFIRYKTLDIATLSTDENTEMPNYWKISRIYFF
jgi:phenylacetate-CoA ligase